MTVAIVSIKNLSYVTFSKEKITYGYVETSDSGLVQYSIKEPLPLESFWMYKVISAVPYNYFIFIRRWY